MDLQNSLHNQKGFSLTELMVTVGLLVVFSLIVGIYIQQTTQMRTKIEDKSSFVNEINLASIQIEKILAQGIDIRLVNRTIAAPNLNNHDVTGAWSAPASGGAVINVDINNDGDFNNDLDPVTNTDVLFDSDTINNDPSIVSLIAVFLREDGNLSVAARSRFVPTAIYYQQQGPNTSGVIYISTGSWTAGAQTLGPRRSGTFFSRISRLRLLNPDLSGGLRSFDMEITFRKFGDSISTNWRWCPMPDIVSGDVACSLPGAAAAGVIDHKQTFKIILRNNLLVDVKNPSASTRAMGQVYFFNQPVGK